MMNDRFVLDTNIFVSAALFPDSKPDQILRHILCTEELLASVRMLEELSDVLERDKFDRYISLKDREDFLILLIDQVTLIEPETSIDVCRDPKDNMILELAVSGNADFILTGDRDLLVLNPFQSIQILTPDAWLNRFT